MMARCELVFLRRFTPISDGYANEQIGGKQYHSKESEGEEDAGHGSGLLVYVCRAEVINT